MPGLKFCNRQEECPLVMGAVEAKVRLQQELNVARMEWDAKRVLMNKLYSAAVKLRAAQPGLFRPACHRASIWKKSNPHLPSRRSAASTNSREEAVSPDHPFFSAYHVV